MLFLLTSWAALHRRLGQKHPKTWMPAGKLAQVLAQQGKHAEAEEMFRGLLASTTLLLGQEHPETLDMAAGVAASVVDQEKYAEAEEILVPVLATRKRVFWPPPPATLHLCVHTYHTHTVVTSE